MSPKSRGRPKGRGRPRRPGGADRPRREPTHAELVLADVADDADDLRAGSLLDAELQASEWLATAVVGQGPGRGGETALVRDLVAATAGRRRVEAWLALDVLATICPGRLDEVTDALAEVPDTVERPAWAVDPGRSPERPVRARLWTDPWNSERIHILDYEDPEPHSLLVHVTTDGGVMVHHIVVGQHDPSGPPADGPDDDLIDRGEQDVDEALTALADALRHTDMYWPPQEAEEYVVGRALAHWRSRDHDERPEWQPVPDDERRALVDEFVAAARTSLPHDPGVLEVLADTFVDFGEGYLENGVLGWSPGEVDRFMTDWVHRKVILDDEATDALPAVLRAWLAWALPRTGLAPEHVAPVLEAVDDVSGEYHELLEDDLDSPSKALLSSLLAEGVDLENPEAVAQAVSAYNARQAALSVLDPN